MIVAVESIARRRRMNFRGKETTATTNRSANLQWLLRHPLLIVWLSLLVLVSKDRAVCSGRSIPFLSNSNNKKTGTGLAASTTSFPSGTASSASTSESTTTTSASTKTTTNISTESNETSQPSSLSSQDTKPKTASTTDASQSTDPRPTIGRTLPSKSLPTSTTPTSTSTSSTPSSSSSSSSPTPLLRVAYQGEPGAYSEQATRSLLGGGNSNTVLALGKPSFDACFRAVLSGECDYACLPIENSLGGSIHDNYDLMLRYDLTIIAEHEFRVHHCLLVQPGVQRDQIKYAISHPQALAQCDNYLRRNRITPIPTYDTAGSAKMLAESANNNNEDPSNTNNKKKKRTFQLPDGCTPENTAAIASSLAGETYALQCLEECIEDDETNFTRFLLLARHDIIQYIMASGNNIPTKTSVVFTLSNTPGALYKALACFALREIDFSKIESRPTSASLLNFLKFKSQQQQHQQSRFSGPSLSSSYASSSYKNDGSASDLPRFRYCFYLDFLGNPVTDAVSQNALEHLREQADFVRVLGTYPQKSVLVGPVADAVQQLRRQQQQQTTADKLSTNEAETRDPDVSQRHAKIGIVGMGRTGQFLAQKMIQQQHHVVCLDTDSGKSSEDVAAALGVDYYPHYAVGDFCRSDLDIIILAVPLQDLERTVASLPVTAVRGKLVVEMSPLQSYPKSILWRALGSQGDIDILVAHPMVGPMQPIDISKPYDAPGSSSGSRSSRTSPWEGRPFVYEKVRISDIGRCERFLQFFEASFHCDMVELAAEQHDNTISETDFIVQLLGRLTSMSSEGSEVNAPFLPPTPVMSEEYASVCNLAEYASRSDYMETFYSLYKYNNEGQKAAKYLTKLRDNLARLEKQLVQTDAYLQAREEMTEASQQRLLAETKALLQQVVQQQP